VLMKDLIKKIVFLQLFSELHSYMLAQKIRNFLIFSIIYVSSTPTFLLLSVRWNHFSIDPEIEWPKSFLAINIFMNFWFCALSWVRFSLGHSHSKSQLINLACCKSLISFDFVLYIKL